LSVRSLPSVGSLSARPLRGLVSISATIKKLKARPGEAGPKRAESEGEARRVLKAEAGGWSVLTSGGLEEAEA
jgi:hypothetical protein